LNHSLHLWDARGTTDENHFVHTPLIDSIVTHALFDWPHRVAEVIHVELLKTGTGQRAREVNPIEEGIDLNRRLCG
jgi:hypothetical protein